MADPRCHRHRTHRRGWPAPWPRRRPPTPPACAPAPKPSTDDDTHNQRSEIALEVTGTSATPYPLPVHEMVDLPRAADSAPVIPLIKRPDERIVTMQAHQLH
ncbi:GTP cyclohydrolase, FolE2/MptA family [Streptomyces sp. NPDC052107]|uniref:GTP cyclohydrolase, FolE2/MptA family n=1 Tax=Streptomyces sp. NPDC052107 TaxID=3155632 RepID=UPI0034371166